MFLTPTRTLHRGYNCWFSAYNRLYRCFIYLVTLTLGFEDREFLTLKTTEQHPKCLPPVCPVLNLVNAYSFIRDCLCVQKITCSLNAGDRFHSYKPSVPPLPCAVLLCSWLWIPVCDNWVNYWGPDSAQTPARYLRVTERHQRWNIQHNQVTRERKGSALLTTRSVWHVATRWPAASLNFSCIFHLERPLTKTSNKPVVHSSFNTIPRCVRGEDCHPRLYRLDCQQLLPVALNQSFEWAKQRRMIWHNEVTAYGL